MEWNLSNACCHAPYNLGESQPSVSMTVHNEAPGIGMLLPPEDGDRPAPNTNRSAWDPTVQLPSHAPTNLQPTQQQMVNRPVVQAQSPQILIGLTQVKVTTAQNSDSPLRCIWKGCQYSGTFGRRAELCRHVTATHINPQSFKCPVEGCKSTFNRNYNLKAHLRRKHKIK